MSHIRPLLVRLALALLATVLLCAIGYLGLGLLIWSHGNWAAAAFGRLGIAGRYNATAMAYARAMASCFSADRDGDGVCDGIELFHHSNPDNARIHPQLRLDLHITRIIAGIPRDPPITTIRLDRCVVVRAGERCPVWGQLNVPPFYPHTSPAGFRLRLTPSEGASISLPGGALEAAPLLVPVSPDGSVAFDVWMPANPGSGETATHDLTVDNAATGENLATLTLLRVWPLPPSDVTMEKIPAGSDSSGIDFGVHYRLQWPPVPPSAEGILIEAARQEQGTAWHLSEICRPKETRIVIWRVGSLNDSGIGELKFRVTPIRYSPPH